MKKNPAAVKGSTAIVAEAEAAGSVTQVPEATPETKTGETVTSYSPVPVESVAETATLEQTEQSAAEDSGAAAVSEEPTEHAEAPAEKPPAPTPAENTSTTAQKPHVHFKFTQEAGVKIFYQGKDRKRLIALFGGQPFPMSFLGGIVSELVEAGKAEGRPGTYNGKPQLEVEVGRDLCAYLFAEAVRRREKNLGREYKEAQRQHIRPSPTPATPKPADEIRAAVIEIEEAKIEVRKLGEKNSWLKVTGIISGLEAIKEELEDAVMNFLRGGSNVDPGKTRENTQRKLREAHGSVIENIAEQVHNYLMNAAGLQVKTRIEGGKLVDEIKEDFYAGRLGARETRNKLLEVKYNLRALGAPDSSRRQQVYQNGKPAR